MPSVSAPPTDSCRPLARRTTYATTPGSSRRISEKESGRAMLRVDGLHVYYDAIHALQGVSFRVDKGEMVTLLGANGARKTTTLKTISALLRARRGTIELEGDRLNVL